MTKSIRILRQNADGLPLSDNCITLFSKAFSINDTACQTIVVHEDFPQITGDDIDAFGSFCDGSKKVVVSGCKAVLHPYRLIYANDDGFCRPLVNIPQSIRGNRHLYPDVLQIIPALLFIPQGIRPDDLTYDFSPGIYIMDEKKLLDKTRFPDSLYLTRMKGY